MNRLPIRSFSAFGRTAANLTSRHGNHHHHHHHYYYYYNCQYGSLTATRGLASTSGASESQKEFKRKLPLSGVKVLDMTRVLAGVCSAIFKQAYGEQTDLLTGFVELCSLIQDGIRLIDQARRLSKSNTRFAVMIHEHGGLPMRNIKMRRRGMVKVNRNKRSLGLSFAHPEGVEILHKLIKECDVLVENYLPNSLKKYNLDYETVRKLNPRLIYASITGYGQTGPYSNRPGFDVMVEAEFGLMWLTGERDRPPVKVGVAVTDLTTGLYACNSIMAALLARGVTDEGQHLDVCLSDCQVATLANMGSSVLISGKKDSGRWGTAHPSVVPYQGFKTADGNILIGGANDRLFGILCDKLNKPELKTDPRFLDNNSRVQNRTDLETLIETETVKQTTKEWLSIFEGSGLPYAAVNDIQGTMNHEHVRARNMVQKIDHPSCGPIDLIAPPVKYSSADPSIRRPPPLLGEHTEEVLGEVVGVDAARIEDLRKKGVVA